MLDNNNLEIAPYNPTGRQVVVKSLLGLITGLFIAFLVFIMLLLIGGMLQEALSQRIAGTMVVNPLLPLILLIIAFIGTFIGSIVLAWFFNLLYSDKYYDMGKMFSLTLTVNIIIFILFIGLYVLFASSVDELFFVLAVHVFFTVFVSLCAIEMSTNPNYAAVHLIGTAFGLTVTMLFFAIFYKTIDINEGSMARILIALPPVLAYFLIPLCHGIREKLYYKFYSMGNNFFYIPSLNEVMVDEAESDDVSVETN